MNLDIRTCRGSERRRLLDCPIIGVASDDIPAEELVMRAGEAIATSGEGLDDAVLARLAGRMSYLPGDVTDDALYRNLATEMNHSRRPHAGRGPAALCARPVRGLRRRARRSAGF